MVKGLVIIYLQVNTITNQQQFSSVLTNEDMELVTVWPCAISEKRSLKKGCFITSAFSIRLLMRLAGTGLPASSNNGCGKCQ
jgi:hypothetical protein